MIDKLEHNPINSFTSSVYDFNELSLQELLNKYFQKINECVENGNKALNFVAWLKNEGLPLEVEKEITLMYQDGRITEIINKLANDVKKQINDIEEYLDYMTIDGGTF